MKNPRIEVKTKKGIILTAGLWEFFLTDCLTINCLPPFDELKLYLNGEEVEKPSEMEEEQ